MKLRFMKLKFSHSFIWFVLLVTVICTGSGMLSAETIFEAIKNGDGNHVETLLKENPELLNGKDDNGRTPLHFACGYNQTDIAKFLIKKGADVDAKDETNTTPLHYAAVRGYLELVQLLLKSGSKSFNDAASWGNTPLHMACERGHTDVVRVLLDSGADIESRNVMKRTPLVCAARESGSLETVKLLIDRGAVLDAQDISNDTALTLAAWRGFKDLANYLMDKKSVIPEEKLTSTIHMAAEKNLERLYNYILEKGVTIPGQKDEFYTLLHLAASGGSMGIAKSLLKKGFNADLKDKDGWAPIHYAASRGKTDMVKYLIQSGVDKNSRTMKGETAYHVAVFRECPETAEVLKKLGVDTAAPKFPQLKGPYMGQTPPGRKPVMFLPGIVSGHFSSHSAIVFSPDGNEACWTEMYPPKDKGYSTGGVMVMKKVGNQWTYPQKSTVIRGEPFYSPCGKRLYFLSRKSLDGKGKGGAERIWYMEKTATGWSEEKPLDDTVNSMSLHWTFSTDKKGNLYFSGSNRIWYAQLENGKYKKPVDISELYNNKSLKGFCPFISPDGDFIIFSDMREQGERNIDLYVSFKKKDGSWTDRINLGSDINGGYHDVAAGISPDGKYLFFLSAGNNRPRGTYWVDAEVVYDLKPKDI